MAQCGSNREKRNRKIIIKMRSWHLAVETFFSFLFFFFPLPRFDQLFRMLGSSALDYAPKKFNIFSFSFSFSYLGAFAFVDIGGGGIIFFNFFFSKKVKFCYSIRAENANMHSVHRLFLFCFSFSFLLIVLFIFWNRSAPQNKKKALQK